MTDLGSTNQPVCTFPPGVKVVGMVVHAGQVIVATSEGVYLLRDGTLWPLRFAPVKPRWFSLSGFWQRVWDR